MPIAVYILALAAFVVGTQSYVFSGLLADLATDLDVSVSTAGQLIAAFAITSAIASPLVVSVLSRFERKRILIGSLSGVAVVNFATAFLPVFEGFLAARVLVAIVSAGVMPMAGAIGASLVPPERQGQALGIILSGLTIAFIVGVPIGTVIGSAFGWRSTFVFAAIVALAGITAIAFIVPASDADAAPPKSDWSVLKKPVVVLGLFLIGTSFIAAYPIIAYLGPIITASTSLEGAGIGAMQAAIGFGSIGGLIAGSILADRRAFLPNMRVLYLLFAIVLGAWSFVFMAEATGSWANLILVAAVIFFTSATLIAPSPAIEKALVQADPGQSALTLALNTSVIYLGQGIGAGIGGVVVGSVGFAALSYVGAGIAMTAFLVAIAVRRTR